MEVGELISFYRKQAGMTIDELASRSGVPKGTLNKIIGGVTKAPTLDNMKSIAKALGKTLADFDDTPGGTNKKSPAQGGEPAGPNKRALLDLVDTMSEEEMGLLLEIVRATLKIRDRE